MSELAIGMVRQGASLNLVPGTVHGLDRSPGYMLVYILASMYTCILMIDLYEYTYMYMYYSYPGIIDGLAIAKVCIGAHIYICTCMHAYMYVYM